MRERALLLSQLTASFPETAARQKIEDRRVRNLSHQFCLKLWPEGESPGSGRPLHQTHEP